MWLRCLRFARNREIVLERLADSIAQATSSAAVLAQIIKVVFHTWPLSGGSLTAYWQALHQPHDPQPRPSVQFAGLLVPGLRCTCWIRECRLTEAAGCRPLGEMLGVCGRLQYGTPPQAV